MSLDAASQWIAPILASILSSVIAAGGTAAISTVVNRDRIATLQASMAEIKITVSDMRDKSTVAEVLKFQANAVAKDVEMIRARQELMMSDIQRLDNKIVRMEERLHGQTVHEENRSIMRK